MIEVHLYGLLRELVKGSRANEDTVMQCEYKEGEKFSEFIVRLGLDMNDIGDCFINGVLAHPDDLLNDGDRVGLFPFNMVLIDGGMHIKHHPYRRNTT